MRCVYVSTNLKGYIEIKSCQKMIFTLRNALIVNNVASHNDYKHLTLCTPLRYDENYAIATNSELSNALSWYIEGCHLYLELNLKDALRMIEHIDRTCRYKFEVKMLKTPVVKVLKIEEDDNDESNTAMDDDFASPFSEETNDIKNSLRERLALQINRFNNRLALMEDYKDRLGCKNVHLKEIETVHSELEMCSQ